jgi:hypothetical protein
MLFRQILQFIDAVPFKRLFSTEGKPRLEIPEESIEQLQEHLLVIAENGIKGAFFLKLHEGIERAGYIITSVEKVSQGNDLIVGMGIDGVQNGRQRFTASMNITYGNRALHHRGFLISFHRGNSSFLINYCIKAANM